MRRAIHLLVLSSVSASFSIQADNESWYTFWGAGLSSNSYSGERGAEIKQLTAGDAKDLGIKSNVWGFYWPYSETEIMGFVVNGLTTTYSADTNRCLLSSVYVYTDSALAFSYMNFFGSEIGDKWYLRSDLGYVSSSRTLSMNSCDVRSDQNIVRDDDTGIAMTLSGGYGFTISEETRVLLGIEYTQTFIQNNEVSGIGITINGLW